MRFFRISKNPNIWNLLFPGKPKPIWDIRIFEIPENPLSFFPVSQKSFYKSWKVTLVGFSMLFGVKFLPKTSVACTGDLYYLSCNHRKVKPNIHKIYQQIWYLILNIFRRTTKHYYQLPASWYSTKQRRPGERNR